MVASSSRRTNDCVSSDGVVAGAGVSVGDRFRSSSMAAACLLSGCGNGRTLDWIVSFARSATVSVAAQKAGGEIPLEGQEKEPLEAPRLRAMERLLLILVCHQY